MGDRNHDWPQVKQSGNVQHCYEWPDGKAIATTKSFAPTEEQAARVGEVHFRWMLKMLGVVYEGEDAFHLREPEQADPEGVDQDPGWSPMFN